MSRLVDVLADEERECLHERAQPRRVQPMLATLTDEPFSDPEWIFERKLDGIRCLVFRSADRVRLVSRSGRDMNATWPEIVDALERSDRYDIVADGEIVAFDGNRTSFSRLQGRSGLSDPGEAERSGIAVHLYLFDLLHVDGYDTTRLSQRSRKTLLRRAVAFDGTRIRYTPHRNEEGEALLEDACERGWEGLIAKDAGAAYVHGRSRKWLKLKCVNRQELVIGGYTEPKGSRVAFGALLVGYYENGTLRYAGRVGTGYDDETLERLGQRLERLQRERSPFSDETGGTGTHFVRPVLVAEIGFTEWTRDGKLRHPRFIGLRTDKDPEDVHRERAGG